jgi:hypothetical protein
MNRLGLSKGHLVLFRAGEVGEVCGLVLVGEGEAVGGAVGHYQAALPNI